MEASETGKVETSGGAGARVAWDRATETPTGDAPSPQGRPGGASGSLRARMLARKRELASRTTEFFPVPRYDSVLAVELQAIPWEESEQIIQAHMRQQRRQMLLNAADEIVAATVAFHEIRDDGTSEPIDDATRWSEIAEAYLEEEMPDAPYKTRERVALIDLCTDQGVMALSGQFRRWLGGADVGIGKEVRRDFGTTT